MNLSYSRHGGFGEVHVVLKCGRVDEYGRTTEHI